MPFAPSIPGAPKLESDDDNTVPTPLVHCTDDDDNSDYKSNDGDNIMFEDVDSDDEEILEEVLAEGHRHTVRIRPTYYNVDFLNIRHDYPDEDTLIHMCPYETGYRAGSVIEQGFINVENQLDSVRDECLPPVGYMGRNK